MELWQQSWRSAASRLYSHVHGEPKRELCHIIMEIGCTSILFTRCTSCAAFLPKIMERPRGSSVIIMEMGRSSILFLPGVPGAQPSYPRSWRVQEGALPSSWRSAARQFFLTGRAMCATFLLYPKSWRAQEGALSSSWRSVLSRFFYSRVNMSCHKRELHPEAAVSLRKNGHVRDMTYF